MKNKILNILICISLGVLITLIVLLFYNIIDIYSIGIVYAFWGSLLVIFAGLNLKFKKYSDLEETIYCLRRTRRAIASIKTGKELSYVKRLAILNQITNSLLLMEDLISQHEYYPLKDNLTQLYAVKEQFSGDFTVKVCFDKAIISAELKVFDEVLSKLKELQ